MTEAIIRSDEVTTMPMVQNVLDDKQRKVRYIVEAPDKLSRGEVMLAVLKNSRKRRIHTNAGDVICFVERALSEREISVTRAIA